MKRARIIYNPTSGREKMQKNLPEILDILEKGGYETSAYATQEKGDGIEAAKLAAEREFDLVIAAGGDGTVNEVLSGLLQVEEPPLFGILPTGTSNDFAHAVDISMDMKKATENLLLGEEEWIDVGKANGQYFINVAGGGSLMDLSYEIPSKLKTVLGQAAYYIKGIEKLPQLKPYPIRIECEEHTLEEEVTMFFVCNSSVVAGYPQMAPGASLQDGLLDVWVLKKSNMFDFMRILRKVKRGKHEEDEKIIHFQTKEIKIHSEEKIQLNIDGEYGGDGPFHIEVIPKKIKMIIGKK